MSYAYWHERQSDIMRWPYGNMHKIHDRLSEHCIYHCAFLCNEQQLIPNRIPTHLYITDENQLMKNFLSRFSGKSANEKLAEKIYAQLVSDARQPFWFRTCAVKDDIDGRFGVLIHIVSIALIAMEEKADDNLQLQKIISLVTEDFIDDMDGQLRQIGIGDVIVGKHIGKMVSALGGRMQAVRDILHNDNADDEEKLSLLGQSLIRNIFDGEAPDDHALAQLSAAFLHYYHEAQHAVAKGAVANGQWPVHENMPQF